MTHKEHSDLNGGEFEDRHTLDFEKNLVELMERFLDVENRVADTQERVVKIEKRFDRFMNQLERLLAIFSFIDDNQQRVSRIESAIYGRLAPGADTAAEQLKGVREALHDLKTQLASKKK